MFRSVIAIALGISAMYSAVTPASASPSPVFSNHMEQVVPHSHLITTPGKSMIHPPSKKKPL